MIVRRRDLRASPLPRDVTAPAPACCAVLDGAAEPSTVLAVAVGGIAAQARVSARERTQAHVLLGDLLVSQATGRRSTMPLLHLGGYTTKLTDERADVALGGALPVPKGGGLGGFLGGITGGLKQLGGTFQKQPPSAGTNTSVSVSGEDAAVRLVALLPPVEGGTDAAR